MPIASPVRPLRILIAYAPEDSTWIERFHAHISVLQASYPSHQWYNCELRTESAAIQLAETYFNTADLIILFMSADFLALNRYYEHSIEHIMKRSNAEETRLIPVLLRSIYWNASPLSRYQPLPSNGQFINQWPDHDAAFTHVVQQLGAVIETLASQQSKRPSVFSQHVPLCDPPYTCHDLFTDRQSILKKIKAFFVSTRPQRTPILALSGIGGIGKTSIALEYCYQTTLTKTYQETLWFNASSRIMLSTYATALADQIAFPQGVREDDQQLFFAIKQWLQNLPNWLLVLDQIEDMTLVGLIVPPLSNGHVLLTTRRQSTGQHATFLPVTSMDINSSALYLLRRMQILPAQAPLDQAPVAIAREAQEVANTLHGFPLALNQVGAYLEQYGVSFSMYLAYYQKQRMNLLSKHELLPDDRQESVVSVHLCALEPLQGTPSLDLLYLLAFLYPDSIPLGLLTNGASALSEPLYSLAANPLLLHQALGALRSSSLIHNHADSAVFQIQRITQDVLIDLLTIDQQEYWAQQAVLLVNHAFPEIRFDTRIDCERFLPQAEHCAILIERFHLTLKEGALLLERLGSFCYRRAAYHDAKTYLHQALQIYEHHAHENVLETAQVLNSLGILYYRRAQYKKAEALHLRALKLREDKLGADDPKTMESQHNLALIYGDLGKYQEAEYLYLRVLTSEERTKDSDDPDIADTLNNLGLIYAQQGRFTEAKKAYRRADTIYRRSLTARHPDRAYPLNGLGALAEKRGDYQQAKKYYQQALDIRQRALEEGHPEIARSITKLAGIAELQSDFSQAEILYQQALTQSERILGHRHPDVALILNNQALLATRLGKYSNAEALYQRSLSIYKFVFGQEHPAVASVLNNFGQCASMTGQKKRAEKLLRQALSIREKLLATTHPSLVQSIVNLATVLADQQQNEEAEALFQRAWVLYPHVPIPRHPDIAQMPEKYASLLECLHKSEEARALRELGKNA